MSKKQRRIWYVWRYKNLGDDFTGPYTPEKRFGPFKSQDEAIEYRHNNCPDGIYDYEVILLDD